MDQSTHILKRNPSTTSSFRLRSPSLNSIRLRRTFDLFDKNNDGVITVDELNQALSILGFESDTDISELNSLVQSYIQPGNFGLLYDDFETFHRALDENLFNQDTVEEKTATTTSDIEQVNADLTEAFKVFDVNGDGFISAAELQIVLEKLGFNEGKDVKRVKEMIGSVDRNQDGLVDFLEFKDMMRNVLIRSS